MSNREVLVLGHYYWAKDKDEMTALKKMKGLGWRGDKYLVFSVTPRTQVDTMGGFTYYPEDGEAPLHMRTVEKKGRKWVETWVNNEVIDTYHRK